MGGFAHLDSQCVSPMIDDPISHPVMDFLPLVTLAGRTFFVEHGETLRTHAAETIQAEALVDLTAEPVSKKPPQCWRRALPGNAGVGPDDLAQGRIGEIVDGARPLCGCRGLAQHRGTLQGGNGEFGMWLVERVVDDAPTEGKAAISQCGPAFDEQMDGLETYIWTSLTSRGNVRTSRAPTLGDFWPRDRGVEGSRCSLRMTTNEPNGVSNQ